MPATARQDKKKARHHENQIIEQSTIRRGGDIPRTTPSGTRSVEELDATDEIGTPSVGHDSLGAGEATHFHQLRITHWSERSR